MIKVSMVGTGVDAAIATLANQQKQVSYATSRALNVAARTIVDGGIKKEMRERFKGGATAYSQRAFRIVFATREKLEARVELRTDAPSKGTPWDKALAHLFTGGTRAFKKMEGAFRRIGVLPDGFMVVPGDACPLDSFGNPPVAFIRMLLSYLQAAELTLGYKANMTQKKREKMAEIGRSERGYKSINGVVYFVSRGPGVYFNAGRNHKRQHLPAGVWEKSGIHGAEVRPVFLFVRAGTWGRMIDLKRIADQLAQKSFDSAYPAEFENAMRTAR